MRVDVTATDIKNGICEDISKCAVALAVLRAASKSFKNKRLEVFVDEYCIGVYPGKRELLAKTSTEVRRFIKRFDKNKDKCKPFSFTLKLKETEYI